MTEVCKKPGLCKKFVAAIVVFVLLGAVCWHAHHPRWTGPKPGTGCLVQFKSEFSTGYSTGTNDSYVTTEVKTVVIDGELVAVKRDAILLRNTKNMTSVNPRLLWIPKNNILFIEYTENKN